MKNKLDKKINKKIKLIDKYGFTKILNNNQINLESPVKIIHLCGIPMNLIFKLHRIEGNYIIYKQSAEMDNRIIGSEYDVSL